jgi:hypothetical protein
VNALTPYSTQINGHAATWTSAIWRRWYTVADDADPKWRGVTVSLANYYTPRPYVDEYNRGSRYTGFTYTLQPGNRVCMVEWPEEPTL